MSSSDGTDVSMWQTGINWWEAQKSVKFAYVKLTEGVGWRDPAAAEHINGARAAGVVVGGYHFARPDTNAPEADAETFVESLATYDLAQPGALPPCLDMEKNAGVNMISWTQRCAARVRQLLGYDPLMIYANTSWWQNQLGGGGWLDEQMYAWVAEYGPAKGQPRWMGARAVMHQFTDAMAIRGYPGLVDGNYAWVDLAELTQGGGSGVTIPVDPRPDGWWTVERGQTLSGIGSAVGIAWETLAQWNGLGDPNRIDVGQRLRLTAPDAGTGGGMGGTYTVAPGDTLSAIGDRLGVSWQEIYAANRGLISDPDRIQVGWVLLIPEAGSTAPPPSTERVYVVQPGDSLTAIGARLGVNWMWLAQHNGIDNPDVIFPDQQLVY